MIRCEEGWKSVQSCSIVVSFVDGSSVDDCIWRLVRDITGGALCFVLWHSDGC